MYGANAARMLRGARRTYPLWIRFFSKEKGAVGRKLQQESSVLTKNLASLEGLTQRVERAIKMKKVEKGMQKSKEELSAVLEEPGDEQEDTDALYASLAQEEHAQALFPAPKPFVALPENMIQSLSVEAVGKVSSPQQADWKPLLTELIAKTDVQKLSFDAVSLTPHEYHALVKSIPKKQRGEVIHLLHELAYKSGVVDMGETSVVNDMLALCVYLEPKQADVAVRAVLRDVDTSRLPIKFENSQGSIPATTLTRCILVNHYARMKDPVKVRALIDDLNTLPLEKNPLHKSPILYTNVMQMYMRMGNYRLARETFDTMTFMSMATAPSQRTYTSMVLLDTLNNNVQHGLEVYNVMKDKGVEPEGEALLALAKGCGTRSKFKDGPQMINRGWKFVIEYYNLGHPITERVMEVMMYLAYVDGDLGFARAIWMNVCEQNQRRGQPWSPRLLKWLFNTYYKVADGQQCVGLLNDNVRTVRNRVMNSVNFGYAKDAPPMLPRMDLEPAYVLSEARAVWKWAREMNSQAPTEGVEAGAAVNPVLYEAYMYVVGRWGTIEEFRREWANHPHNDRIYCMALHVARHQGSVDFGREVWEERGRFRTEQAFQVLSPAQQDVADFKFARLMVSLLTSSGEVDDAVKVILSSKKRFSWQYYHIKSLLNLCERVGAHRLKTELLKVCK